MIPKIIHYCWFGGKPLPDDAKKCIESWKKFCPDYEIKEWNESNFDISAHRFAREAYENKKWAFVGDDARVNILFENGGIYMDIDVELVKNIDVLLENKAFCGFETDGYLAPGLMMGAEKRNEWFKMICDYFADKPFVLPDGTFETTPNPVLVTQMTLERYPLAADGSMQDLGDVKVYPKEYFNPMNMTTGKIVLTPNTFSIHHYKASWYTPKQKFKRALKKIFVKIFGEKAYLKIRGKKNK